MMRVAASLALGLALGLAFAGSLGGQTGPSGEVGHGVELLGETVVKRLAVAVEAPVGGLSGLSYDAERDLFVALSDDAGRMGPPRFYELRVTLGSDSRPSVRVEVEGATVLRQADGSAFPRLGIDPESLARTPAGRWIVASEGHVESGVAPALLEFEADGSWVGPLALPRAFRLRADAGPRHNLALESATISPDGRWLFTAVENALVQDGAMATPSAGSPSRLLRIDLQRRRVERTFIYRTEPIAVAPAGDAFAVNGLVDLLALDGDRLLALERSFTVGEGNVVRLFIVDLAERTGERLRVGWRSFRTVAKRSLVDLAELGIEPDNLEGMAWGPSLADGRRTLVLVADDNFNPGVQRNQLIVLAIDVAQLRSLP